MSKLETFIGKAIIDLTKLGITVKLINAEYVKLKSTDKDYCEGFFSDSDMLLSVATKNPIEKWGLVFLHEYCHVQQHLKQTKSWIDIDLPNGSSADVEIALWLEGKKLKKRDAIKYIRIIQRAELECEKMTVRLIRKYKLGVDVGDYIRGANAYILYHNILINKRKWYNTPPDISIKLKSIMPTTFIKSYTKLTKEIEHLIQEECYK